MFIHYSYIKTLAQLAFEKRNVVKLLYLRGVCVWGGGVFHSMIVRGRKLLIKGHGICNRWHRVRVFEEAVAETEERGE